MLFKGITMKTLSKYFRKNLLLVMVYLASFSLNADISVTTLPIIDVDNSNLNLFSTPIVYYNGSIFTVNVEPSGSSLNAGINLKTVVRKVMLGNGKEWLSHTIDQNTIEDEYHTQASIGVDKLGFIHIAYGMHNMPWQYVVSDNPSDISAFSFYGDEISIFDKGVVKFLNKTPFPSTGSAAIPGNQITYPAFFYDNNYDLYVTYRFAVKPRRHYRDRILSGGIARYDLVNKEWQALGGNIQITKLDAIWQGEGDYKKITAFASSNRWTVYLPRLAFDRDNGMHVSWLWRKGGAGRYTVHPSYAYSPNDETKFYTSKGKQYNLPISVDKAEWVGKHGVDKFDSISDIEVDDRYVYIVLHRQGKTRELIKLNRLSKQWIKSEAMPHSASTFKVDRNGGQWAFATGLKVFYRKTDKGMWNLVFKDTEKYRYPKVIPVPGKNEFYIHTQSLDQKRVKIYKLEF